MLEYIDEDGVLLTREEYRKGLGRGRVRQVLSGFEKSIVDESKKDETDLNILVKRWLHSGGFPEFTPGQFADISEPVSYQEMHQRILEVENSFMTLPPDIREHFQNSAVLFADALADPARHGELTELGVIRAPSGDAAGGSGGSPPPESSSGSGGAVTPPT